jgi:hypothetical protein
MRSSCATGQHAFANEYPPYELFRAFMGQYRIEGGLVHRKIVEAGMYNIVWDTWMKKVADDRRHRKARAKGSRGDTSIWIA